MFVDEMLDLLRATVGVRNALAMPPIRVEDVDTALERLPPPVLADACQPWVNVRDRMLEGGRHAVHSVEPDLAVWAIESIPSHPTLDILPYRSWWVDFGRFPIHGESDRSRWPWLAAFIHGECELEGFDFVFYPVIMREDREVVNMSCYPARFAPLNVAGIEIGAPLHGQDWVRCQVKRSTRNAVMYRIVTNSTFAGETHTGPLVGEDDNLIPRRTAVLIGGTLRLVNLRTGVEWVERACPRVQAKRRARDGLPPLVVTRTVHLEAGVRKMYEKHQAGEGARTAPGEHERCTHFKTVPPGRAGGGGGVYLWTEHTVARGRPRAAAARIKLEAPPLAAGEIQHLAHEGHS